MDSNMEFYTTEFNNLNNMNLEATHLFCHFCKKLLISKIYTRFVDVDDTDDAENSTCLNICKTCHDNNDDVQMYTANYYLTGILSKAEFLCFKSECNFVGPSKKYEEHTGLCKYQAIKCLFDEQEFNHITDFSKHLSVHQNVSQILMEELNIIDVELPYVEENAVFVATIQQNTFILYFKRKADMLTLEVGHHMFNHFVSSIEKFTVIYKCEDIQMRQVGVIQELNTMLKNAGNDDKLELKLSRALLQGGKITIYVNMDCMDVYKNKLGECPICMQQFTKQIKQCSVGHSICASCAEDITKCPICRDMLPETLIYVQHILAVNDEKCKNSNAGCLASGQLHQENCPFTKWPCMQCKTYFYVHEFYNHVVKNHVTQENFVCICIDLSKPKRNVYIKYRTVIFCVKIFFGSDVLKFSVSTLPNIPILRNHYKFKVIIYNNAQMPIAETGCDCNGAIVSLVLSSFAPRLYIRSNGSCKGNIKCEFKILPKSQEPIKKSTDYSHDVVLSAQDHKQPADN